MDFVEKHVFTQGCYASVETVWSCQKFVDSLNNLDARMSSALTRETYRLRHERSEREAARARSLFRSFRKSGGRTIDFMALARESLKKRPHGMSEQRALGRALNRALHVIDAHARLLPTAEQNLRFKSADENPPNHQSQPNLESYRLNQELKSTLYIRIRTFSDVGLCKSLRDKLMDEREKAHFDNVILDLRQNGGGLLAQGVCVAGLFVGKKPIVTIKEIDGSHGVGIEDLKVSDQEKIVDQPMAVLIDGASASASEFVAGALQDYERAWIVGARSFGKGGVQTWRELDSDPTLTLGVTTGRFYLPSGRSNQRVGISPDFAVAPMKFVPREADIYFSALPTNQSVWPRPRSRWRRQQAELIEAVLEKKHLSVKNVSSSDDRVLTTARAVLAAYQNIKGALRETPK
jgi:hypothetical protein